MTHYQIIEPTKSGLPRIKIIANFGYDEQGKKLRKTKTVTLTKLTESNIINAISQFEKSLGTQPITNNSSLRLSFRAFSEEFMLNYVHQELKVKSRNTCTNYKSRLRCSVAYA